MSKLKILLDRAHMMDTVRSFFKERQVTETDVPILSSLASVDAHIDLIPASFSGLKTLYLHSSPEYGMKRLLSEGLGDIYQLSHVFRDGESGNKHSPEFMMAEWYRLGFSFQDMIDETLDFCRLFLGTKPALQMTYREMFKKFAGIDYVSLSQEDLARYLEKENIPVYDAIESEGKDGYLNLILTQKIEPLLGEEGFFVLTHYPASQAALAQTTLKDGERVAERFEVYYNGLELANGYHELADAEEQERRLIAANEERQSMKKNTLPIDTLFLDALKKGLPPCSGVAVGFDRLMMLRHQTNDIKDVIAFGVQ